MYNTSTEDVINSSDQVPNKTFLRRNDLLLLLLINNLHNSFDHECMHFNICKLNTVMPLYPVGRFDQITKLVWFHYLAVPAGSIGCLLYLDNVKKKGRRKFTHFKVWGIKFQKVKFATRLFNLCLFFYSLYIHFFRLKVTKY